MIESLIIELDNASSFEWLGSPACQLESVKN